jgi:hypothetical protein
MSDVVPIWNWKGNLKGGAGETEKVGSCPQCGSPRFFSRANGGTVMNSNTGQMCAPKPECMECGYPNEQGALGYQHAGAIKVVEGAVAARQGKAPAPAGTMATIVR